jgi:hypothetical protein
MCSAALLHARWLSKADVSDPQQAQLVNEITYNALTLVQDPFGNYVVQYILDLNDNRFSDGVTRQFTGNVCALSVQKFGSNVIEKVGFGFLAVQRNECVELTWRVVSQCIRVAEHTKRKLLIEELLNRTHLEKLLRDSYGNYCVQVGSAFYFPVSRVHLMCLRRRPWTTPSQGAGGENQKQGEKRDVEL